MRAHETMTLFITNLQVPEEDVPVRSVSMAADGSILVAANNKVMPILPLGKTRAFYTSIHQSFTQICSFIFFLFVLLG
jgi:hypothetical protein